MLSTLQCEKAFKYNSGNRRDESLSIEDEDKTSFPCTWFKGVKLNKWKRMANFGSSIKSIISCLMLQETDKENSNSPLLRKSHFGKRQEYEKS